MKKVFSLCLAVLCFGLVRADNDKIIRFDRMPEAARQTVARYFGEEKVMVVKQEKEWFDTLYEVQLSDGTDLEFFGDGRWKEIDCKRLAVPAGLIPAEIRNYVGQRFPGRSVVKIERDRRGYEVELDDDTDLKFDLKFNLVDFDR